MKLFCQRWEVWHATGGFGDMSEPKLIPQGHSIHLTMEDLTAYIRDPANRLSVDSRVVGIPYVFEATGGQLIKVEQARERGILGILLSEEVPYPVRSDLIVTMIGELKERVEKMAADDGMEVIDWIWGRFQYEWETRESTKAVRDHIERNQSND